MTQNSLGPSLYEKLKAELVGKKPDEVREIKGEFFKNLAGARAGRYAWLDSARSRPAGVSAIKNGVDAELRNEFKELYDDEIANEVAGTVAIYYY